MVAALRYDSFDYLNAHLEARSTARQGDKLCGHSQTIGQRLISDIDALMGLPASEYEACDHVNARATSDVHVRGFVHEVIIGCGNEIIARHKRSYAKADMNFDPLHFLPLIEQKLGALDQATPLQVWICKMSSPPCTDC